MTDTVRVPMSRQEARLAAQSGVVAWLSGYKQEYRAPHDTLCDLIADAMLAASPQGEGGWITHDGGPNPVPGKIVEYRMPGTGVLTSPSDCIQWDHQDGPGDIIAYRVTEGVKP